MQGLLRIWKPDFIMDSHCINGINAKFLMLTYVVDSAA